MKYISGVICLARAMAGGYSPLKRHAFQALRKRIRVVLSIPWGGGQALTKSTVDLARRYFCFKQDGTFKLYYFLSIATIKYNKIYNNITTNIYNHSNNYRRFVKHTRNQQNKV